MDYTKSATVIQMEFMTEWNNLLGILNKILLSIPNIDNTRVFLLLLNKINSNCHAAINLIYKGFINEGLMIFRSAIETVIYAKYLQLYPEEQKRLFEQSEIITIKYQFIQYKELKTFPHLSSTQELLKTIEHNIKNLIKTNTFLRQQFPQSDILFDDKNMQILDKFFARQKLCSQNAYSLLKEIQKKEPTSFNTPYNLHDIFYPYYDEDSTILHGNYLYWNEQPGLDQYHLLKISSHLLRISVNIDDLLQDYIPKDFREYLKLEVKKLIDLEFKLDLSSTPSLASQNPFGLPLNS